MKNCKFCEIVIQDEKLTFCNQSCSAKYNNAKRKERGWTHSPETIKLLRDSGRRTGRKQWKNTSLDANTLVKWKESLRAGWKKKYESKTFDELSIWQKRKRVIEEQSGACADCGLSKWKSIPINLEMDHKDGNTDNNSRENLWALCPNCHSTTETWRGRNKPSKNGEHKVSDDVLLEALRTEPSIRKALLKVGLAAKGNNYERAKKLKTTNCITLGMISSS
jgi:5-methylcytosine-specific restriction endonuclease McrA